MNKKGLSIAALSFGACLYGQNPSQAQPPPQPEVKRPAYVRRVSLGGTLSVLGLSLIPKNEENIVTQGPPVDALHTTSGLSRRVGYGLTAQVAVTERLAVNISLFRRSVGYQMTSDIFEGTDITSTPGDERRHTIRDEDTRARLLDLPVTIRYYGKDRHDPGKRWFVEVGAALREVSKIKTSVATTVGSAATDCCDLTPARPERRRARGLVAGAGLQFIDAIGIRVIPAVRYTRWGDYTFNSFSTSTRRDQIEAMISLTF